MQGIRLTWFQVALKIEYNHYKTPQAHCKNHPINFGFSHPESLGRQSRPKSFCGSCEKGPCNAQVTLGIWRFEYIARVQIEPSLQVKLLVVTCAIHHFDVHPRISCAGEKLQQSNRKRSDSYAKSANN